MKKISSFLIMILFTQLLFSQKENYSEPKNLFELNIITKSQDFKSSGSFQKIVSAHININNIELFKIKNNYNLLNIEECITSGTAGNPTNYIYPLKLVLEGKVIITGIKLISGTYVEFLENINLAPRQKPKVWGDTRPQNDDFINKDIYQTDAIYPSHAFTYNSGYSINNTVVNIQLNAAYFNPLQKKVFILTDAKIKVYYSKVEQKKTYQSKNQTDAVNIILTTEDFQNAANLLKDIHEINESVTTEIVTKEWISSNYNTAVPTSIPGYATINDNPINSNYDYELTKKIISYLNDNDAHPNLESITILGDAEIIPPSYYFFINHFFTEYNNWIVSDLHYASPDYDMVLNYMVGRLPVSSVAQADHMVNKIQNMTNNLNANWFYNAELIGGIPFSSFLMFGETICLDPVNKGWLKGFNINKKFSSNNTETDTDVLPIFSNENTGLIFHIGHGSGDAIQLNPGSIDYSQLMGLNPTTKYPVMFSIACMNGGYDSELMNNSQFSNCFAEGFLRSQAGGVGYFGGTRVNYGVPGVILNSMGQAIVGDEPYMAKMLTLCFETYSEGHSSLGKIYKETFAKYMEGFNTTDIIDYVTVYEFVLLGDPVLNILPSQGESRENVEFSCNPPPFISGSSAKAPTYYYTNSFSLPAVFTGETNSSSVNISLLSVDEAGISQQLDNTTDDEAPFDYTHEINQTKLFQLRYETDDFKESWLYYYSELTNNIPPTIPILSEIDASTNTFVLNWTKAIDYDGDIDSYSITEWINPVNVTEECNNMEKWNNNGFSINANGQNSTNCFYSNTGDDINNSIVTASPTKINENDELTFWKKYDIEDGYDYAYVEISEDGFNYSTLENYTGTSNSWTQSTISLNDYVEKSVFFRFRYQTDASINNSGFYVDNIYPVSLFEETNILTNITTDTTYEFIDKPIGNYFYRVCATDATGLDGSWSNTEDINLNNINSSNYQFENHQFTVIPTAIQDEFIVKCNFGFPKQDLHLDIYNILGQKVYTTNIYQTSTLVDIDNRNSGIYIFTITGNNFKQSKKVFVNKKQ